MKSKWFQMVSVSTSRRASTLGQHWSLRPNRRRRLPNSHAARENKIMRSAPMLAMILALLATACSHQDTQLDAIARELEATVNRCVIDVRDKTSKYETSSNCRSLSEIAKRYVAAGGLKQSAPCTADRIAEGSHAKAWMALAISKTGDPNLMIW